MTALEFANGAGVQYIVCHCANVSSDNVHGKAPASYWRSKYKPNTVSK